MKFVVAYQEGSYCMSELCRVFGVSRKTGYKWLQRYQKGGPAGLSDQSRAHRRHPLATSDELVSMIVETRGSHPTWGPRKLKAFLEKRHPECQWPAASTIGVILKQRGFTKPRRKRHRVPPYTQPFSAATAPNLTWCADYKGWFRTGDGHRCDPLTITDAYSRFLIRCKAVPNTRYKHARKVFESAFAEYGLPDAIRTDNGSPFASLALGGLSRLSVWWLKLGIRPERIEQGRPEQNGRHERFHLTLKQETAQPPKGTLRSQQKAFDVFIDEYNYERPHEALGNDTPGQNYQPSTKPYPRRLPEVEYGDEFVVRRVHTKGEIKWRGSKLFVSEVLIRETVGLRQVSDRYWQLCFGPLPIAWLDDHEYRIVRSIPSEMEEKQIENEELEERPERPLVQDPHGGPARESVTYDPG
jgi:transposase InsO family protein